MGRVLQDLLVHPMPLGRLVQTQTGQVHIALGMEARGMALPHRSTNGARRRYEALQEFAIELRRRRGALQELSHLLQEGRHLLSQRIDKA
jgi:hypothetical protein